MALVTHHSCLHLSALAACQLNGLLTVLKVHRDIITPDVRRHCNDRGVIELSDQMACRDTVEIWHDDVHQYHVILGSCVHLVHSLETVELVQLANGLDIELIPLTALSIAQ